MNKFVPLTSKLFYFIITGPREPKFYVPSTPDASDVSTSSEDTFPEDLSFIESSDEGESSRSLADKMAHVQKKNEFVKPFKFRNFQEKKQKLSPSPSSSPISLPSPEIFIISSDEELEKSMVEMEAKISIETGFGLNWERLLDNKTSPNNGFEHF